MKKLLPLLAVFVLCFSLCVPASAANFTADTPLSELPDINEIWDSETYPYAITYWDGYMYTYVSSGPLFFNDNGLTSGETPVLFKVYVVHSTTSDWTESSRNSEPTVVTTAIKPAKVKAANYSVSDEDGYVRVSPDTSGFFPHPLPPLAAVIQGVTAETLNSQTVPALGGTMKVLVLCGVGLIASLVVLKLFGKRSLISLR